jgi:hypothetical protein
MALYRDEPATTSKRTNMQNVADLIEADRGLVAVGPIVIEAVTPQLDGGRYPVKRVVGESVDVEADIFREGHDLIFAMLSFREKGTALWERVPMTLVENDRWAASFVVDNAVKFEYAIEAWPDPFGTWQHDVRKKLEADQPIALELIEGHDELNATVARSKGAAHEALAAFKARIDAAPDDAARVELMLDLGDVLRRRRSPARRLLRMVRALPEVGRHGRRRARHVRRCGAPVSAHRRDGLRHRLPAADPPDRPRIS